MRFASECLLSPQQVAGITGLSTATLANWRSEGRGPDWLKAGRKVWYPVAEFESWMEGNIKHANQKAKRNVAVPSYPIQDEPEGRGDSNTR